MFIILYTYNTYVVIPSCLSSARSGVSGVRAKTWGGGRGGRGTDGGSGGEQHSEWRDKEAREIYAHPV